MVMQKNSSISLEMTQANMCMLLMHPYCSETKERRMVSCHYSRQTVLWLQTSDIVRARRPIASVIRLQYAILLSLLRIVHRHSCMTEAFVNRPRR